MSAAAFYETDPSGTTPRRVFNIFRLVVAGLILVAGRELSLGAEAPELFAFLAFTYAVAALALGFPFALHSLGYRRLIVLQLTIDILMLASIMWISGGYSSGIPVLLMVYVAGAGLLVSGRMVLFFAALATLAVLVENAWRYFTGGAAGDNLHVAIVCIGFFAIALSARLLSRRAATHESLAEARGEALGRQQAINERIIEDMQDGVMVLGADGRLRQSNPRASTLLGFPLRDGMMMPELDAAFADCGVRCAGGDGVLQRMGPAGKLLRCRAVCANPEGARDGDILVYLTDFEEIQKQVQQLKLAALGRLTASMAHEIRNPLTAVTQAADLLTEEKRGEIQVRLIRIINDNARRIERMVREVLALGRRDEAMREPLPLGEVLSGIIEEFSLGGHGERAVFALRIDEDAALLMDRAHFHQVVANLLTNARRYCSGKPGAVRVFTTSPGRARIALHVHDDGPGIEEARREDVFDPFFTTDAKGTGLGLYIARELAEANDASLELIADGPGAHFVLTGRSPS